jgi:methionine-rich copper-binding protein CopC
LRIDRHYVYQPDQLLCKTIEPETGASVFGYDGAGNVTKFATGLLALSDPQSCNQGEAWSSGRVVNRTYDARNRVRTLIFPDGNGNQAWTYTSDGKPSTITTQNGATANSPTQAVNTYSYNKRRLLRGETLEQPGWYALSLGYDYDANGSLAQVNYPEGFSVTYTPNALGQPTRAGTYASNVSYHPNGAIKQFTYGNGILHSMVQNVRQLPAQVSDGGVLSNNYSYDKNGNVAQILDGISASADRVMGYDGLDRLSSAVSLAFGGNGQVLFTYDALDNLRSNKLSGVRDENYWYDVRNHLTNIHTTGGGSTAGLAYDEQGNLHDKDGQIFQFDYGNRLRDAFGKENYRYDGYGRRIQASSATGSVLSLYGQDGILRYQLDNRQSARNYYVTLEGSLVAKVKTIVAPAVPALIVPGYSATGTYTVSWGAVSDAARYELQQSSDGGVLQVAYKGNATSFDFADKPSGHYAYQVRACNAVVCSDWSAQSTVAVGLPPATAPALSAPEQAPNGNYTVSWTAIGGISSYALEENANSAGWAVVQEGAGLARNYATKQAGSYAYRASACNPAGCGPASPISTVLVYYAPAAAPAISSPATTAGDSFTVTWTVVAGATSYGLEESVNGGGWSQLKELSGTSHVLTGKATGRYSYRVRACNGAGCGPYSSVATTGVLLPPAGTPTISAPGASSNGSYTVSWTAVAAATSYQLEEQKNGGSWTSIQNSGETSRAITGKANGNYGYHVRGCNASGCGPWSGIKTVVVNIPPPIPAMPSSLTGGIDVDNSVRPPIKETNVYWSSSAGATYYQLSPTSDAAPATLWYSGPYTDFTTYQSGVNTFWVRACNAYGCSAWKGGLVL